MNRVARRDETRAELPSARQDCRIASSASSRTQKITRTGRVVADIKKNYGGLCIWEGREPSALKGPRRDAGYLQIARGRHRVPSKIKIKFYTVAAEVRSPGACMGDRIVGPGDVLTKSHVWEKGRSERSRFPTSAARMDVPSGGIRTPCPCRRRASTSGRRQAEICPSSRWAIGI